MWDDSSKTAVENMYTYIAEEHAPKLIPSTALSPDGVGDKVHISPLEDSSYTSPLWRIGGVSFDTKPKEYSNRINRKERQLLIGLTSLLIEKRE